MSRKDNNTEEEVPEQQPVQEVTETPIQIVSDSELIHIKLNRMLEQQEILLKKMDKVIDFFLRS